MPFALTYAAVRIDARISGCSCKLLVFSVRNMKQGFRISVAFRQAEIDKMHKVRLLSESHQEVLRLKISMNDSSGMNKLHDRQLIIHC